MEPISDGATGLVVQIFSIPGVAIIFAALMLVACSQLIAWVYIRRVRPLRRQLELRLRALWRIDSGSDIEKSRSAFAVALPRIEEAMRDAGAGSADLRRAWRDYRQSVLDPSARPWETPLPAEAVFGRVHADVRVLGLWANLFVAIGLLMTFLGVVAALSKATAVIGGNAADAAAMQGALADLLTITATKFWTSISGVACSIWLRLVERRWSRDVELSVEELTRQLDAGVRPVSAESLALRQITATEAQTALLLRLAERLEPRGIRTAAE